MAKTRRKTLDRERFQKFLDQAKDQMKPKRRRRRHYGRTKRHAGGGPVLSNPPLFTDLLEYMAPGVGGFVITKLVANLASSQIAKRWPRFAKHAGALGSISSFLGAWWFGHKVRFLSRWHSPITVGSGIAAAHNLMQIYFPDKVAWLIGSPKHAAQQALVAEQQKQARIAPAGAMPALPDHLEEVDDDPSWYTFSDAYDGGRYTQGAASNPTKAPPADASAVVDTDAAPLDDDIEDLATGLFANNGMTSSLEN